MLRTNIIYFTKKIIDSLVVDIIGKIPGINQKRDINIVFNEKMNTVNVKLAVKEEINNVYDVAKQVQNYIFFRLCKMFDLNHININVTIIK